MKGNECGKEKENECEEMMKERRNWVMKMVMEWDLRENEKVNGLVNEMAQENEKVNGWEKELKWVLESAQGNV